MVIMAHGIALGRVSRTTAAMTTTESRNMAATPNNRLTEISSLGCTSLIFARINLTPVKTRCPLIGITWPYRGLKFTAHRFMACSSLSVSGEDRKSARGGAGCDKKKNIGEGAFSIFFTRYRSWRAGFFDRPYWPRACNRQEFMCFFFKLAADGVLDFDWIASSQDCSEAG